MQLGSVSSVRAKPGFMCHYLYGKCSNKYSLYKRVEAKGQETQRRCLRRGVWGAGAAGGEFGEQVPQVGVWGAGLMSGFAGEGKSAYLFQFTGLAQTGSIKVRIKQSVEQNQGLGGRQGNSSRGSFPHSCLLVFKARLWE